MGDFENLTDREFMAQVAKRPGMYTGFVSYERMVHFLTGYDIGQRRSGAQGLDGFPEWLVARVGRSSSLGWPHLALLAAFPDRDLNPYRLAGEEESEVVAGLFVVLDQFLAEREASGAAT
ncbi:hypothetical protein [Salininema proteolyticum]|uniref:Uncharacterized protein n=1 Tax=Salininema proteolyticum TaxID=1607685 RepID=A0ABV8U4E1_9ACTN